MRGGAPTKATLRRSKTFGPLRKRISGRPQSLRLKRSSTIVPTSLKTEFIKYLKQRDHIRGIVGNVHLENLSNNLVRNSVLNMSFLVGTGKVKLYCKHLHNLMKIKSITPGMIEALKKVIQYVKCPMETIKEEYGSVHGVPGEIPEAHETQKIYNTLLDRNLLLMRELSKNQKNVLGMIRNIESGMNMVRRVGLSMFFTIVQTGGLLQGDTDSTKYGMDFYKDMRKYFTSSDIKPVEVFMSSLTAQQKKELEALTVEKLAKTAEIIRETGKVVLDDGSGDVEPAPTPRKGKQTKGKATTKGKGATKSKATTKGRRTTGKKKKAPSPSPPPSPEYAAAAAESTTPPFVSDSPAFDASAYDAGAYDAGEYDDMTEEELEAFMKYIEPESPPMSTTPPVSPKKRRSRRAGH